MKWDSQRFVIVCGKLALHRSSLWGDLQQQPATSSSEEFGPATRRFSRQKRIQTGMLPCSLTNRVSSCTVITDAEKSTENIGCVQCPSSCSGWSTLLKELLRSGVEYLRNVLIEFRSEKNSRLRKKKRYVQRCFCKRSVLANKNKEYISCKGQNYNH